jgi:hypothetical protein
MRQILQRATGIAALAALGLSLLAGPASAQQTPFYIFDGDSQNGYIVQNGQMINNFTTAAVGIGYPVAVRNTVWLGDRDNNGAAEYTLGGVPTGNTSAGAGGFTQLLDGTGDAFNNFGIEWGSNGDTVTVANQNWTGQTTLFNLPTTNVASSITVDTSAGVFYIGGFNDVLNVYTFEGTLLNSFNVAVSLDCLAYEALTDTLWVAPNQGSQVVQLSKTGAILNTINVVAGPGQTFTAFGNNFGGEMPLSGGGGSAAPEPGSVAFALLGISALGIVARRKR